MNSALVNTNRTEVYRHGVPAVMVERQLSIMIACNKDLTIYLSVFDNAYPVAKYGLLVLESMMCL